MSDEVHRNVNRVVEAGASIGLDVQPVKSLIFAVDGEVVLADVSGSNQLVAASGGTVTELGRA
jgi:hypothetical protein